MTSTPIVKNGFQIYTDDEQYSLMISAETNFEGLNLFNYTANNHVNLGKLGIKLGAYNSSWEHLAQAQTILAAVQLPPASTTLKLNHTVLLQNGVNTATIGISGSDLNIDSTGNIIFTKLPECNVSPTTNDQLVNKLYVDNKVGNKYFYDDCFGEGASVNGLLCCRLAGSGSGASEMAPAEANRFGIVRIQTPSSNSNTTWTTRSPFLWQNIDYVEIIFRGWPVNTSNNTTLSIGLLDNVNSLDTSAILLMYSTNVTPTGVWQLRVDGASASTFSAATFPQLVNTWMKIRITNTNNTGSWSATLTRLDTNQSQTLTGTGIATATQFFIGGGVSCVSGASTKRVDFDSIELLLK